MSLEAGIRKVDSLPAQLRGISVPLLGALAYAVFLGATFEASYSLILRLISQALALGVILVWAIRVWRGSADMPRTPLDAGLGLFLLAHLVSTATSVDPRLSLESSLYVILFVLLFYLLVDRVRVSWTPERVAGTLLLLSQVVVVATLLEIAVWRWGIFAELGWTETIRGLSFYRGRLALGHANPLGWFLAMMVPFWLEALRRGPSRQARIHALLWLGLLTAAEVSTFSRGGWLVAATATAAWSGLTIAQTPSVRDWVSRVWQSDRARLLALGVMVAALVAVGLGTWWAVTRIRPGSASFRFQLWSLAAQLVAERPLTGSGPGTYGLAIRSLDPPPPPGSEISTHAHNGYLNLAAETGLFGVAALFVLALQFARTAWPSLKASNSDGMGASSDRARSMVFLPAVVGLLAANLFDTTSHFPYMTVLLVLLAAVLLAPQSRPRALTSGARARFAPVIASSVLLGSFLWFDLAELSQLRGIRAAQRGDLLTARLALDAASKLDPSLRVYRLQGAVVRAQEHFVNEDRQALQEALQEFDRQVTSGLWLRTAQSDLAWLRWLSGDPTGAVSGFRDAIGRAPWSAELWMGLGFVFEQSGDLEGAREAYAMALALDPGLSRSGYWNVGSLFQERGALLRRAMRLVPGIGGLPQQLVSARQAHLAFYAGDEARVHFLLDGAPMTEEALLVEALLSLKAGDPALAEEVANRVLSGGGAGGQAYLIRGRSRTLMGDGEQARRDFLAAARFGQREGWAYIGEMLYEQGRYTEAIGAYEEGLRPTCPAPARPYAFDSNVFKRRDYLLDFTPEILRCTPMTDLGPLYLHLADVYRRVGRGAAADALLDWLTTYDLGG